MENFDSRRVFWSFARRAAVAVAAIAIVMVLDLGGWLAVPTAEAAIFTVDSQTDAVDANPGDGICATASLPSEGVKCTLRAATMEANALAGADTINLPAGTYTTTRFGGSFNCGDTQGE